MNFHRPHLLSSFILLLTFFLFTGCYKVYHNYLIKGVWYIDAVEIDGGSTNFMQAFLPDYENGNGKYKVYMLENGLVRGEYYTYDTIDSTLHAWLSAFGEENYHFRFEIIC